jgi:hypothetical protein
VGEVERSDDGEGTELSEEGIFEFLEVGQRELQGDRIQRDLFHELDRKMGFLEC